MKNITKLLRLILIGFFSLFITNGVKATSKKNINQRVNSVRESITEKSKKGDISKTFTTFTDEALDQWYNWGDWNNWRNWNNWNNWANWGNWGNWYNY